MAARRLALPVVDLAVAEVSRVASLKAAARSHGFFYVVNHGVDQTRAVNALQHFFALEEQEKMQAHKNKTGNFRGYISFFEQGDYGVDESDARINANDGTTAAPEAKMDFKEVFHIGTELPLEHPYYNELLYSSNVWPKGQVELREAVSDYYEQVYSLSNDMFQLFALALGLPRNSLLDKAMSTPMNSLNCVHYPPLSSFPGSLDADQLGIGAHTDFEAFTLLNQHGPSDACLDILQDGQWCPVPPIDGALVVNIGDMLARWSGDLFQSTVHRARNHPTTDRFSLAFFRGPDFDAVLSPAEIKGKVRDYPPIPAGQHMLSRISTANEALLAGESPP
mmetsp:Transcript_5378/g.10107  ORF Transcript_5378/g.10107 Transcript_5378/m.10107 type:complete len:336 (-) Transcript_5378:125-1132(-)